MTKEFSGDPGENVMKIINIGSLNIDRIYGVEHFVQPGETIKIPTAVRAEICEGWVLQIYPRSSLGYDQSAYIF